MVHESKPKVFASKLKERMALNEMTWFAKKGAALLGRCWMLADKSLGY